MKEICQVFWKLWLTFAAAEGQDDSPANRSHDNAWVYCSSCCSTGAFRGSIPVQEGGVRVLDKVYRQEIVALLFTRQLIRHCRNTEYCRFCNLVIRITWTSFWYLNYILVFAQWISQSLFTPLVNKWALLNFEGNLLVLELQASWPRGGHVCLCSNLEGCTAHSHQTTSTIIAWSFTFPTEEALAKAFRKL